MDKLRGVFDSKMFLVWRLDKKAFSGENLKQANSKASNENSKRGFFSDGFQKAMEKYLGFSKGFKWISLNSKKFQTFLP